jgi:hypothetical protein
MIVSMQEINMSENKHGWLRELFSLLGLETKNCTFMGSIQLFQLEVSDSDIPPTIVYSFCLFTHLLFLFF